MALLSPHYPWGLRLDRRVRRSRALALAAVADARELVTVPRPGEGRISSSTATDWRWRRLSIRRSPPSIYGAGAGEATHFFDPRPVGWRGTHNDAEPVDRFRPFHVSTGMADLRLLGPYDRQRRDRGLCPRHDARATARRSSWQLGLPRRHRRDVVAADAVETAALLHRRWQTLRHKRTRPLSDRRWENRPPSRC